MEHPELLRSQIKDSCKLALPVGLRDLMCDISREVLRTQPPDIYNFIADYLSALMITRDSLSIACKICRDMCECSCLSHLEEELKYVGLEEADIELVKSIVLKHFEMDEVKESDLLMKLFRETNIDEELLEAIQEAVRRAYLRHQMDHPKKYEMPSRASEAVDNTLRIYQGSEEDRNEHATKIQAAFRGYLVRKDQKKKPSVLPIRKKIRKCGDNHKISVSSVSSQSLAGSYLCLPRYVPYSAHYMSFNEKEEYHHESRVDYSQEKIIKDVQLESENKKKIGFDNHFTLYEIDPQSCPSIGVESDESIEEQIDEEVIEDVEDLSDHTIANDQTSCSRDLVQDIMSPYNAEEKDKKVECLLPFEQDLDDGKSSKNEKDGSVVDGRYLSFDPDENQHNETHNNDKSGDVIKNTSKESLKTLNDVNRDLSVLIKPVEEHLDLKSSLHKFLDKSNGNASKSNDYLDDYNSEIDDVADGNEELIQDKRYSNY